MNEGGTENKTECPKLHNLSGRMDTRIQLLSIFYTLHYTGFSNPTLTHMPLPQGLFVMKNKNKVPWWPNG